MEKSLAERLFGTDTASGEEQAGADGSDTPPAALSASRTRSHADVLFGGPQAGQPGAHDTPRSAHTRQRRPEDVLFGEAVLRDDEVLTENYHRLRDVAGMTGTQQAEIQAAFGRLRENLDLSQAEARTLHTVITDADVKDPEAWEAEAATWPRKTRTMLRERYGDEADAVLTQVHRYISNHRALTNYLRGGLEMHPRVVEILAERVRSPWRFRQAEPA